MRATREFTPGNIAWSCKTKFPPRRQAFSESFLPSARAPANGYHIQTKTLQTLAGAELLQRIWVGMILGRLLFKQGNELPPGRRYWHRTLADNLRRGQFFSVNFLVGIVIRPQG